MNVTELVRTPLTEIDIGEWRALCDIELNNPLCGTARKRVVDELKRLGNSVATLIRILPDKRWEYLTMAQNVERAGNRAPSYMYWHAAAHPGEEALYTPPKEDV